MNTKNIKNKVLILLAGCSLSAAFTSCSDFLDEDNKTGMTADLTYSTVSGIEGLVKSCYAYTRGWWGKEAGLGLTECGSDLFLAGFDNKQKSLTSYNLSARSLDGNTADDAVLDHYWEMFYDAIDVCNNALKYIPLNTNITDTKKEQYLGEAKFLRALYYSQMVATWGPIPYNETPVSAQTTTPVRVPEAVVYKKILTDIDEAIAHFKAANFVDKKKDGSLQGRATLYAAVALKARVALYAASWLGNNAVEGYSNLYQIAQAAAEEVIASSGASFYSRYSDVWNYNNEAIQDNKEAIWGVAYNNDLTTENCIPYRYKTNSSGSHLSFNSLITRTGYTRGGSAMLLMFVPMWNNGNSGDVGGNGTGDDRLFVRVLGTSTASIKSKLTGQQVDVAKYYSPYGRGFTRYTTTPWLWKSFENVRSTDQRCEATMMTHYNIPDGLQGNRPKHYPLMGQFMTDPEVAYAADGNYFNQGDTAIYYCPLDGDSPEGKAKQAWAKDRYRIQFLSGGDIPVYDSNALTAVPTQTAKKVSDVYGDDRYNNVNIGGWKSYPGLKKFLDDQYNPTYPTHDISGRDAIVFRLSEMYLIKAECQLNNGGDALATLNQLRQARAISGQDNSLKGSVDINTILDERALELCGEQQRWFDLKRTHTLLDRVKKYNGQAAGNIQAIHYYRPIPEAQMISCTNVITTPVQQSADGVLQYSATADGFWQNPGY
ncbi:MAG: RagB/SusD family nutrient uptake outer membrane protein [Prevotella sp.]|nr:RagB/SusD family nutrient uptake outer membrane protein [Prevotella sp.]